MRMAAGRNQLPIWDDIMMNLLLTILGLALLAGLIYEAHFYEGKIQ